jgi:PAT family beta-lactamase induction signal transducer AmpG
VEGAASAVQTGGILTGLQGLFSGLPPESFASAIKRSGVSPASLGSGYVVFFAYSALIGILPVLLALVVLRLRNFKSGVVSE